MTSLGLTSMSGAAMDVAGFGAHSIGSKPFLSAAQQKSMTPAQKRLMGVAQDFEGVLVTQMLTAMRHAHLAKDPLDSGNASDIMHSMLDSQMGKKMAHSASFGLADALYRELSGAGGGTPGPAATKVPSQVS